MSELVLLALVCLVAGANRLAGTHGMRGRLAFAAAVGLLAGVTVPHDGGAGWWFVGLAALAALVWRSMPTRWLWDAAHFERYARRPEWDAVALGAGLILIVSALMFTPFGWPQAGLAAWMAAGGWLIGGLAYRLWGLSRGWLAASYVNPAEWVAGAFFAGAILILSGGLR